MNKSDWDRIQLEIAENELASFLSYLGIGVLTSIKRGIVPPDVGIWTLGRPDTWKFLVKEQKIPRELIEVFQSADELSAIQKLLPEQFDSILSELIMKLETTLKKNNHPIWNVSWSVKSPLRKSTKSKSHKRRTTRK